MAMAPVRTSLEIFDEVGMEAIRAKSLALTGYLEFLLRERLGDKIDIWTPSDPEQRGAQLSLSVRGASRELQRALHEDGVVSDFREPDVVRVAPTALYNTFHDVWTLCERLRARLGAS
jgi:kynureninase